MKCPTCGDPAPKIYTLPPWPRGERHQEEFIKSIKAREAWYAQHTPHPEATV